jgi:hypothetical protein
MADITGAADVETLALEWKDEQLERVRAVFDSVDSSAADTVLRDNVLAELPTGMDHHVTGVAVFRDLLRVEHRPDRFRRLLRIWSSKVGAAVRNREYAVAGMWFRALIESPVFAEEFAHHVAETRREISSRQLFDDLVVGLVESGSPPEAAPLLSTWGEPLVEYLISQIVTDKPIVNRRHIVDFLGIAGRGDVRHLTARLADPRWFVVRNVVVAVGKAGRVSAVPALEAVWGHDDERVRLEVLRSLSVLQPELSVDLQIRSLSDSSAGIRQAALSLLRANPAPDVVPGIAAALSEGTPSSAEEAKRLVEIIAERRGPEVREALEMLATKKFAVGASKAVRGAARAALEALTDE